MYLYIGLFLYLESLDFFVKLFDVGKTFEYVLCIFNRNIPGYFWLLPLNLL